jgi:hypothetical protein
MTGKEVTDDLHKRALRIVAAAEGAIGSPGPHYNVYVNNERGGDRRARVAIVMATYAARRAESKAGVLASAINAGRG